MNGAHCWEIMDARTLRSRKPEEPDAAAVPQLLPEDIEQDAGIDPAAPRCSMHFKTAGGEWVRCCGQERLFRLPVRDCDQHLRPRTMPFDDGTGGDLTSIEAAWTAVVRHFHKMPIEWVRRGCCRAQRTARPGTNMRF